MADLDTEAGRVRYIEALLLSRALPGCDEETERLESILSKLPGDTMHKLVETHLEIGRRFSELRGRLLESIMATYRND